MPRYRRIYLPNVVHHIIARLVNREFRIAGPEERQEYLRRLGDAATHTDWRILGFAVMSNHIHLCALAGEDPSERLIRPAHAGFAGWLNRRQGRLGPVFADRHRTIAWDDERVGELLAYIHNNPVRAEVADEAAGCDWTSHRAYVGLDTSPAWLDVEAGLELASFDTERPGGEAFDGWVYARRQGPRDKQFSGHEPEALRREARDMAGGPVELTMPRLCGSRLAYEVRARPHTQVWPRRAMDPLSVIQAVGRHTLVEPAVIRSRSRVRTVVAARRLALLVWAKFNQTRHTMACALGISDVAASKLVRSPAARSREVLAASEQIFRELD